MVRFAPFLQPEEDAMANMSYCMFENTERDMLQLLEAMREAGSVEDLELGKYEQGPFERLPSLCVELLAYWLEIAEASDEPMDIEGALENLRERLEAVGADW
jgi:hypothetical protein